MTRARKKKQTYWAAFHGKKLAPNVTYPMGPYNGPVVASTKKDLVECGYLDVRRVEIKEVKP